VAGSDNPGLLTGKFTPLVLVDDASVLRFEVPDGGMNIMVF
jgi:hypothetical protein